LAALPTLTQAQQAPPDDALQAARAQLGRELEAADLGSAYAAMVGATTAPEISAATYRIRDSNASEPAMRLYKLPLEWPLGTAAADSSSYLQTSLGLMEFGATERVLGERILARWTAWGGAVGLGTRYGRGPLRWIGQFSVGAVHIESRAKYQGPIGRVVLKPLLENLLFDWRADASKLGLTLGVDWQQQAAPWTVLLRGRLETARIKTFSASSEFVEFEATGSVLTLRGDASRPLAFRVAGRPARALGSFGATAYLGRTRNALGFDRFVEVGGGLEIDIRNPRSAADTLRFSVLGIYGPDVVGWSVSAGLGF